MPYEDCQQIHGQKPQQVVCAEVSLVSSIKLFTLVNIHQKTTYLYFLLELQRKRQESIDPN